MKLKVNMRSAAVRLTPNYGGQPSPEKAKCGFRSCWLLGWRASRSSGVSRAKAEVKGKHEVRRRSVDAELWRTAFARKGEMRFSAFGFWAGVPAVAPASAGRRNERMAEVKGKHEVRRRSVNAELWRTAFARKGEQ